jgi:peptide/nickel transport system substrate-binding protein
MRKNLLRFLAPLFAFSLIAAACGDDDDTGTGEEEPTEEAAEPTEEAEEATEAAEEATEAAEEATEAAEEATEEATEEEEAPVEEGPPPTDPELCGTLGDPNGESGAASTVPADASGGTLTWVHEQEPPDLHLDDPNNNLTITAWVRQAMLEGLYGITAETTYAPELLAEEATVTDNGDGTFTMGYVLRDGLTWSDGTALTSRDVQYTCRILLDPEYLIGDRTGYDLITGMEITSPTEFSITFSGFFAGYKALFPEVYPSHALGENGAAANENFRQWNSVDGGILPSSGSMVFESWEPTVQMNLVRNDLYHGNTSPDAVNQGQAASVDGIEIRFVADTTTQVNALLAGEAQIVMTQPQLPFEELASNDDFTVASTAGPVFEHWGFNLFNPHLADPLVREAIALAINKGDIMASLYTPLFGESLPAEGLGNTYWMSNQPQYENHQGDAGYGAGDVDGARAKLEEAGYTDNGGVYEHPERGPLSLRVGTTGGNELREIQQELIQDQLSQAGIEITIDNVPGGDYFGAQPFNEEALGCANSGGVEGDCAVWDITQFAWVGGPWPGGQSASYRTASGNNPYGYSNADWDARADECDATVDDTERDACYNELDTYVTTLSVDPNGLFMVPLTQKPSFYGFTSALSQAGVAPDANSAGPLANAVDFVFAG